MQSQFLLFVRQHANNWLTASVLGRPEFAAFGPRLAPLKDQIAAALRVELGSGALAEPGEREYENLIRQTLPIELRAVQHDRLIRVPMRFTVLHWPDRHAEDAHTVLIPRLGSKFRIVGKDNILPWAEEVVRGHFHLDNVELLLPYQFERGERLEPLSVTWHGAKAARKKAGPRGADRELPMAQGELARVGVELVEEARQSRLGRAWHRDAELAELTSVLGGAGATGVLLVGGTGVGKTAILHELAHRIAEDKVPPRLAEVPIWHVTAGRILAGMRWLGQWQQRSLEIVSEVRGKRGVLYLDNLLEVVLALGQRSGLSLSQFFLPYILAGELTVVCEANPDALVAAEAHDAAFVRAFRRITVEPLGNAQAYDVLETAAGRLGKEHRVVFTPEALHRALDVLARFGDAGGLPGSGLGLIEQMARGASDPAKAPRELVAADAIDAFSRTSGFPRTLVDPDALFDMSAVRGFFSERIVGQDAAVDVLTNLVTIVKAGLNDPEKPLGSFLFMGPTGVGKTESTLTLAEYLFGARDRLIRLDMSEYGHPGAAARLIGGGPGGEGELTRQVREQPFTVILLDEVEKAAPEVFDLFLQVLGEGRLTDATGRTVRFTHTIVVMTSNLGASAATPIGVRGAVPEPSAIRYREAARQYFRPEFLNRVDFVIPFSSLGETSLRSIARRMLDSALAREGFARRDIVITYDDDVVEHLATAGFEPKYGARPMKRAIEQLVLVPLAERLASGTIANGAKVSLVAPDGAIVLQTGNQSASRD